MIRVFSLAVVFAFLSSIVPAVGGRSGSDYVHYIVDTPQVLTVIHGRVIDVETRIPIPNAEISGELSNSIPINPVRTDRNGYFRVSLRNVPPGTHTFRLNVSATGYDPKSVVGSIRAGETVWLLIELPYNPFDLVLGESSGSIERRWVQTGHQLHFDGWELYRRRVPVEEARRRYFRGEHANYWKGEPLYSDWITLSVSARQVSKQEYDAAPGRRETISHVSGDIYQKTVETKYTSGETVTHYRYRYYVYLGNRQVGSGTTRFTTWRGGYFVVRVGPYRIHYYYDGTEREVITRYFIRTETYVGTLIGFDIYRARYRIDDFSLLPWGSRTVTLTLIPRNNYSGEALLSASADGIRTDLRPSRVILSSPVQAFLTLTPKESTTGSPYPVRIEARDSRGRLAERATYTLHLSIAPKPVAYWLPPEPGEPSRPGEPRPSPDFSIEVSPTRIVVQYTQHSGAPFLRVTPDVPVTLTVRAFHGFKERVTIQVEDGMGKYEFRLEPGETKRHWVLFYYGGVYDPNPGKTLSLRVFPSANSSWEKSASVDFLFSGHPILFSRFLDSVYEVIS